MPVSQAIKHAEQIASRFLLAISAVAVISCGTQPKAGPQGLPLLWLGSLIGGVGLGASFSGALRVITPL
jgi:hypothetical protein